MFSDFTSLCLYLIVGLSSYLFFCLAKSERRKNWRNPLFVMEIGMAILIPSVFAGLRYNVGTDYANYNYGMSVIRNSTFVEVLQMENVELGYAVLVKGLSYFFSNPIIFGVMSAITLTILIYTLLVQYKDIDSSMIFFVYLFKYYYSSYNLVRQSIALVIIFYAMKFIYEHKLRNFLIYIFIAMMFHYSAIVFIPAYFIWNKPKRLKLGFVGKLLAGAGCVAVTVYFRQILSFFVSLGVPYISKYLYLMLNSENAQNRDIVIKIIILVVFIILNRNLKKDNETYGYLVVLYAISVVIGFTGFYTPFFKRVGHYYAISEIVLMSSVKKVAATSMQRYVMRWIIMIAYMMLFVLSAYILKQSHLIPYMTIFSN